MKIYALTQTVELVNVPNQPGPVRPAENLLKGVFINTEEIKQYLSNFSKFIINDAKEHGFAFEIYHPADSKEDEVISSDGIIFELKGSPTEIPEEAKDMPIVEEYMQFRVSVRDTEDTDTYNKKLNIFMNDFDTITGTYLNSTIKDEDLVKIFNEIKDACKSI